MNIYRYLDYGKYELVEEPSDMLRRMASEVFHEHASRLVPPEEKRRPILFTPGVTFEGEDFGVYAILEPRP